MVNNYYNYGVIARLECFVSEYIIIGESYWGLKMRCMKTKKGDMITYLHTIILLKYIQ